MGFFSFRCFSGSQARQEAEERREANRELLRLLTIAPPARPEPATPMVTQSRRLPLNQTTARPYRHAQLPSVSQEPARARSFDACLDTWENDAPPSERTARRQAADSLRQARLQENPKLELHGLTSLPACLDSLASVRKLTLVKCCLPELPDLPKRLTHLIGDDLGLQVLPALPSTLDTLILPRSQLRTLPQLPAGLRHLDLRGNQLTRLTAPDVQLPMLVHLDVSSNAVTELPPLPESLYELFVQHNQLLGLPALPPCLGWLMASHNRLSSVPELPASLAKLYLDHNQLQDLPDSIARIRCSYTINVEHNPLSASVLDRIDTQLRRRTGYPSTMHFNLGPNESPRLRPHVFLVTGAALIEPPLTRAAMLWHCRAGIDTAGFERVRAEWRALEAGVGPLPPGEEPSGSLATFLQRLTETAEYRNPATRNAFSRRVATMLSAIAADPQMRDQAEAIATEALGDCADRIATSLDQIELALLTRAAGRGMHTRAELIALGTDLFKHALLNRIGDAYMAENAATEHDPVEVQLAFRTQLADTLQLPTSTRETLYADGVRLSAAALTAARDKVAAALADLHQLAHFLADWAPWQAHLDATVPAELAPARRVLEAAKSGLRSQLEAAALRSAVLEKRTGVLSSASLDAQTAFATLQRAFDRLERNIMGPVLIAATLHLVREGKVEIQDRNGESA